MASIPGMHPKPSTTPLPNGNLRLKITDSCKTPSIISPWVTHALQVHECKEYFLHRGGWAAHHPNLSRRHLYLSKYEKRYEAQIWLILNHLSHVRTPRGPLYVNPSNRILQITAKIKDKRKSFNNKAVRTNGSCLLLRGLRQLVSLRPAWAISVRPRLKTNKRVTKLTMPCPSHKH